MEVVLNSYIARLVFGYLQDQNLDNVSLKFSKYSPYLQEEYEFLNKGLKPVCCNDVLVNIIKDYCTIKCKVKQAIEEFPVTIQDVFQKQNLISQIIRLLKVANKAYVQVDGFANSLSETINTNSSKRKNNLKRHRCNDSGSSTSSDLEATKLKDLPGYHRPLAKKVRFSGTYQLLQEAESVDSDQTIDEEEIMESEANFCGSDDITYESTESRPQFSAIPERILENKEFQNKLVENINKALHPSSPFSNKTIYIKNSSTLIESQPVQTENHGANSICDGQLIENVIQNILDATEKDPTFDEVVEEVVKSNVGFNNNKKNFVHSVNNCNVNPYSLQTTHEEVLEEQNLLDPLEIQRKKSLNQEEISQEKNCEQNEFVTEGLETPRPKSSINFKPTNVARPPLNQIGAGNVSVDPNFSISKFIIMSSSESNSIFNTSTNLFNLQALEGVTTGGDQVFLDYGNGQAIPFILSNDCVLISNNDLIPQQILAPQINSTNNISSAILNEIPNQITMSEINMNSEAGVSKNYAENEVLNFSSNILDKSMTLPMESRIQKDKVTTPKNCIVNISSARSLSTPRRKSSHVRVLSFSPMPKNNQNINDVTVTEKNEPKQSIIESVQILPKIKPLDIVNIVAQNENSNSNSTNADQNSNVTVIHMNTSSSNTPRRKPELRSCKRVFTAPSNENSFPKNSNDLKTSSNIDVKKENISKAKRNKKKTPLKKKLIDQKKTIQEGNKSEIKKDCVLEEAPLDPMEAWKEMRAKSGKPNFDQHLREIAAKTPILVSTKYNRRRRKKARSVTKKKLKVKSIEKTEDNSIDVDNTLESKTIKSSNSRKSKNVDKADVKVNLLNFKIKTPLKNEVYSKKVKSATKQKIHIIQEKEKSDKSFMENNNEENFNDSEEKKLNLSTNDKEKSITVTNSEYNESSRLTQQLEFEKQQKILENERERRTSNIAALLDTPFKTDDLQFPITPRLIPPSATTINTPQSKLISNLSISKHIDIQTPAFAITPGSNITPLDKETPRSGGCFGNIQTDYSSGGSYYRPDESEDLCKKLDRELAEQMRSKRLVADTSNVINSLPQNSENPNPSNKAENVELTKDDMSQDITKNVTSNINDLKKNSLDIVECAVVLEKIKSFNEENPNVMPHYKFMESLPDLTESSTSLSSCSSSSSSSSSNSSCSTSFSTKSISPKIVFSDINSSEDEDWELASRKKIDGLTANSHLVSEDGQVRFPVRSWITPTKVNDLSEKNSRSPHILTSCCGKVKSKSDLEEKRQRMKAKLIEDSQCITKMSQNKSTLYKKKVNIESIQNKKIEKEKHILPNYNKSEVVHHTSEMDVLTALNLSAKKNPVALNLKDPSAVLPEIDDNATSDVFSLHVEDESNESCKVRNAALALTTLSQKEKNKLTLQIDAQPLCKKLRGRPTKKKNDIEEQILNTELPIDVSKKSNEKHLHKLVECSKSNKNMKAMSDRLPQILIPSTESKDANSPSSLRRKSVKDVQSQAENITNKQIFETKLVETQEKSKNKADKIETDSDEDSTEEDPYEICEMCTALQNDQNNFELSYSGTDIPKPRDPNTFSNLKKIAINLCLDGERHQLKVSGNLLLFSQTGKVKFDKYVKPASICNLSKTNKKNREKLLNRCRAKSIALNLADATSILESKTNLKEEENDNLVQVQTEKTTTTRQMRNTNPLSKNVNTNIDKANNIRNEDIYAVLSHLHGNDGK